MFHMPVTNPSSPASVIDLCDRLRICRRTVQNSFKAVTGTPPLHYMRSIRLNAARRSLMSTPVSQRDEHRRRGSAMGLLSPEPLCC